MEMQDVPPQSQAIPSMIELLYNERDALESWNFEVMARIGGGRHGDVYKCRKRLTNEIVAIKIITILPLERNGGVPSSIIREASVLKELDHVNIVKLLDVLTNENDVYLVFEYLDIDLHRFIISPKYPKDRPLIKSLLQQILSAVAYCHAHKILHRDLKPRNVLVDVNNHTVKIADFGVARGVEVPLSSYSNEEVGTPRYRAPELMLGSTDYSTPIDIWSVGCIFAEMVTGNPLFPAQHEYNILFETFSLLGTPTEETWPGVTSLCEFMKDLHPFKPKDLALEFPDLEPAGVDLLSKMLCQCPNNRISAEDALKHAYFGCP